MTKYLYWIAVIGFGIFCAIMWHGWADEHQAMIGRIYEGYDEYVIPCDTDVECAELNPHIQEFVK